MKNSLVIVSICLVFAGCSSLHYRFVNPTGSSFSQAMEVKNSKRLVFVSGQVPTDEHDSVPPDFRNQCRLVWENIEKQLKDAGMNLQNIVKITTYLSDRKYRRENYEVRHEVLGEHQPAMTIIIAGIYDESWLLEIEVIAAD